MPSPQQKQDLGLSVSSVDCEHVNCCERYLSTQYNLDPSLNFTLCISLYVVENVKSTICKETDEAFGV